MLSDQDRQFLGRNRGKLLCAVVFVVLGILFMTVGFLKTMFVILLAVGGWFFGRVIDDKEFVRRIINNYLEK